MTVQHSGDSIWPLVITIGIGLIAFLWLTATYNGLVRSHNRSREAWSSIEIQLRRRASLVPNIVETVKGYAAHESAVFGAVANARGHLIEATGARDAANANTVLTSALDNLFAVVENYPELKASAHFLALQQDLWDVEEKLAYARQFYNQNVLDYNDRVSTIPSALVAAACAFRAEDFFDDEDRAVEPRVRFAAVLGAASDKVTRR
jgi:LemA protein